MRWGVTFSALLFNMVFTMEVFLLTKNLLTLLIARRFMASALLLCARDARFFDLVLLWGARACRRSSPTFASGRPAATARCFWTCRDRADGASGAVEVRDGLAEGRRRHDADVNARRRCAGSCGSRTHSVYRACGPEASSGPHYR